MRDVQVAVIGAGVSGIGALRALVETPGITAVCFETLGQVGGTWVYPDEIGTDKHCLPAQSSIYKNMRTNCPKQVMEFSGFRFPEEQPTYMPHEDVLKYIQDYTKKFNLLMNIRFSTEVTNVRPLPAADDQETEQWEVRSRVVGDKTENAEIFDSVFVCNGHYAAPLIPEITGREKFRGKIMHSHDYRVPEVFMGRRIVCLGAGNSGKDIAIDTSYVAQEVILSHNKPTLASPFPPNVNQAVGIQEFTETGVTFRDGTSYDCDGVILCTGYKYEFPFLSPECEVEVRGNKWVYPLYKHFVHCLHPTLFFLGICEYFTPFPHSYIHALYVIKILQKEVILPSKEDMVREVEEAVEKRLQQGIPAKLAHTLGNLQWPYHDDLAQAVGISPIPQGIRKLYEYCLMRKDKNEMTFRDHQYEVIGDEDFREVKR